MTTAIPVQIGEDEFASMNQARLYLTEILHSYPIGTWLSEVDSAYVRELLPVQSPLRVGATPPVQVARALFGRPCFELGPPQGPKQKISIMKSIKGKVREKEEGDS